MLTIEQKKENNIIAVAKYRLKNKDKINAKVKEYRDNNIERAREVEKIYYQDNREKIKANKLKDYHNNRDKNLENMRKYRETFIKPFAGKIGTGNYNITLAERNKDKWLKEKLYFYHLEFEDIDGTIFYKYGLTKNLHNRLYNIPYTAKIITCEEISKYEAIYKERESLNNIIKYIPLNKFGGYTECFIQ